MQDKICEVPPTQWVELRDMFASDWPRNIYAYNLLENYLEWRERDPKIKNLKIYSLNGDWSDGTFVVVVSSIFYFSLCWCPLITKSGHLCVLLFICVFNQNKFTRANHTLLL